MRTKAVTQAARCSDLNLICHGIYQTLPEYVNNIIWKLSVTALEALRKAAKKLQAGHAEAREILMRHAGDVRAFCFTDGR